VRIPESVNMSDTITPSTAPRKGGRPRNPEPPKNAADVRLLIGAEIVKAKPKRLRALQNLLASFEDAEKQEVLERQNRLQQEANELRRLDYQRRQQKGSLLLASRKEPMIIESLNKQLAEQEAKIHSLTEEVERLKSEQAVLQQSADALAQLRAEAASKVAQALRDSDEANNLQAEWEELKSAPVTQEIVDRMKEIALRMLAIEDLKSKNRG
jgi:DNA repair exonuclease SbcCD ATPase subunit